MREREERRLIRLARKAGYFQVRIRNDEFLAIFKGAFLSEPRRRSTLDRLEARREAHYAGRRARDARRKALLGGFLVAQCRHKPEVHARLSPDIRNWLASHRSVGVGTRNVEALEGFLADPAHVGLTARSDGSETARRERTHRLILLGAWVLARRGGVGELRALVAAELAQFLEQGRRVARNKALLKGVLGK
ncbi:MAG: hypothetical protein F4Y60_05370 [Boseongicola sp. SB0664_bin_43]|uniref:Uncharacterized protein n=1 Tax=Boseongicola sp. SB0664_bin_43 TaxID=2604844 RepID=A0A6B0Y0B1_9RHOB|nr:hypothetical protein [Boseongicola sp. SB0664_bin_43]